MPLTIKAVEYTPPNRPSYSIRMVLDDDPFNKCNEYWEPCHGGYNVFYRAEIIGDMVKVTGPAINTDGMIGVDKERETRPVRFYPARDCVISAEEWKWL